MEVKKDSDEVITAVMNMVNHYCVPLQDKNGAFRPMHDVLCDLAIRWSREQKDNQ